MRATNTGGQTGLFGRGPKTSASTEATSESTEAQRTAVRYRLAHTVAHISSTVQVVIADDGTRQFTRTNAVTVTGAGDPGSEQELDVGGGDVKLDVHLTPDGRLSSAQRSATGAGSAVISAGLTLATAAASAVAHVMPAFITRPTGAAAPDPANATTPAEAYKATESGTRREALHAQAQSLQSALLAFVEQFSGSDQTQADQQQTRLQTLVAAQTAVQSAVVDADAAYQAWKATHYPTISRTLTNTLDLAVLPRLGTSISTEKQFSDDELNTQSTTASALGVVLAVCERTPGIRATTKVDAQGVQRTQALVYRLPRLVTVAVYACLTGVDQAELALANQPLALVQTIDVWAVDGASETREIPLDHPWFRSVEANVSFDDNGILSEVASQHTSALAAFAKAIGDAGDTITGTLDDIDKVQSALTLTDPATAALTKQVDEAELRARLAKAQATVRDPRS